MVPVIAFVGRHNSGKTTLLIKVIAELNKRGYEVGVIKHAHHNVNIPEGKDSEKLFNAGASVVYTNSPEIQIIYTRSQSKTLDEIIKEIVPAVDIIILEGYKNEPYPKIEVMRQEISQEPLAINNVIARVLDFDLESDIKSFYIEETKELVDFILTYLYPADNTNYNNQI